MSSGEFPERRTFRKTARTGPEVASCSTTSVGFSQVRGLAPIDSATFSRPPASFICGQVARRFPVRAKSLSSRRLRSLQSLQRLPDGGVVNRHPVPPIANSLVGVVSSLGSKTMAIRRQCRAVGRKHCKGRGGLAMGSWRQIPNDGLRPGLRGAHDEHRRPQQIGCSSRIHGLGRAISVWISGRTAVHQRLQRKLRSDRISRLTGTGMAGSSPVATADPLAPGRVTAGPEDFP